MARFTTQIHWTGYNIDPQRFGVVTLLFKTTITYWCSTVDSKIVASNAF